MTERTAFDYKYMSMAYARLGKMEEAFENYHMSYHLDNDNWCPFMEKCEVLYQSGKFAQWEILLETQRKISLERAKEQRNRDLDWFLAMTWEESTVLTNMSRGKECSVCFERAESLFICSRCRDRNQRYCQSKCQIFAWEHGHKEQCCRWDKKIVPK